MARDYPDKIPIICEKHKASSMPDLEKTKFVCSPHNFRYLIPKDLSVTQLLYIIRKRVSLPKEQSLFLFVNGKELLKGDTLVAQVYDKHKDGDGFLYIAYANENVLGW